MKKSISDLAAGKLLSKKEQKSVLGGIHICAIDGCPPGYYCHPVGCKKYPYVPPGSY